MTLSDVLLALGILLLMCEVIKGARPGAKYLTDHLLSLIVFGAAAAEFVLWSKFGTSTYFLLIALSMVDFLSGLALRTRRGAVAVAAPAVSRKNARTAEPPAAEPDIRSRGGVNAAPAAPPAASVAEPVLPDHPDRPFRPAACGLAGSPVTGPAAGQRRAVAGHAAALKRYFRTSDDLKSDGLPGPEAGAVAPALAGAVGGLRIGQRTTPQAAGLRRLGRGRDQLGDEARIGPRDRAFRQPAHGLGHRHQRDAAGFVGVQYLAIQHLF